MTSELEQKINDRKLTFNDVVVGETVYGNPKFNNDIFEYIFQNGSKPRKFWDDQDISGLGSLGGYRDLFGSRYNDYSRRKRKVI